MPTLHEVQAAFTAALLAGEEAAILDLIAPDDDAGARLAVHRNTLQISLVEALAATFPAVERLVDARFFAYAATEFVRAAPPAQPCLAEYGFGFADFLASFPPCRELPYLPDVARLEWLIRRAAMAEDGTALPASAMTGVAPEDAGRIALRLHPALGLIASPWPVDAIWRANRRGAADAPAVDLAAGGVRLEVTRLETEVVMRPLDAASFAFRQHLRAGAPLEAAAEAALVLDPDFPLAPALAALFAEGAVVAVALAPSTPPLETPP